MCSSPDILVVEFVSFSLFALKKKKKKKKKRKKKKPLKRGRIDVILMGGRGFLSPNMMP